MALIFLDNKIKFNHPFVFYHLNIGLKSPYENDHEICLWNYKAKSVVSDGEHGLFGANLYDMLTIYCSGYHRIKNLVIVELESEETMLMDTDCNLKHEIEVRGANILRVMDLDTFLQFAEDFFDRKKDKKTIYPKMVIRVLRNKV